MVECPVCHGTGWIVEEGYVERDAVKCDVCHGSGHLTQHDYEQWEKDTIDVYQAQRDYIRSQTAD